MNTKITREVVAEVTDDASKFGDLAPYTAFVRNMEVYIKAAGDYGCAYASGDDYGISMEDDDIVFPLYSFDFKIKEEVDKKEIKTTLKYIDGSMNLRPFETLEIGTAFYIKNEFHISSPMVKICEDGPLFNAVVIVERYLTKVKPNEYVRVAGIE